MTADELDTIYTELCGAMARLGEPAALPFLARFALLCMAQIDSPQTLRRLIADAASGLGEAPGDAPAAPERGGAR